MTIKVNVDYTRNNKNDHVKNDPIKYFNNAQEMLDYAFKLADEVETTEIVVSTRGKDRAAVDSIEPYDYEIEIYNDYRE